MVPWGDLGDTTVPRVLNNPCFVFQPLPEDRYRMQSKPLGICLILDCIGNDTGRGGCLQHETTAQAGYPRRPDEHSWLSQITAHLRTKWSLSFRSLSSVDWAKQGREFPVVCCKDVYNVAFLTIFSRRH